VRSTLATGPRLSCRLKLKVFLTVPLIPVLSYGQGFGVGPLKEKVVLHRKLPAIVHLADTSFVVKTTSHLPAGKDVGDLLPVMLENELLKNEKSLRVDNDSPVVTISCVVTNYETPPQQLVTRNDTVLQKGKLVQQPKTYYEVTGQLDVTYRVTDKKGKALDSNAISAKYSKEFEKGTNQATDKKPWGKLPIKIPGSHDQEKPEVPPTPDQLRQELLHQVVSRIAPRLVNTDENIEVLLAVGKLKDANKTAEKGMWSQYLEALEIMPPLASPQDDAYRLYNIGVANEALGYSSEDRAAAKKFLEEAVISYGKAAEAKPDEKYFLDPQTRIETAVAYYKTLSQPGIEKAAKVEKADAVKPSERVQPDSPDALTNDKIIEMFKSGVDEESILAEIKSAPKVDFKLDSDGLIELAKNGIKGKIPAAMRERLRASKTPTARK
jgi:hypothetical protein